MIRLIQRRLIIPRGDTGTFTVPLLAATQTGDVAVFTIFSPVTHKKIFEKILTDENIKDNMWSIEFSHYETVNLPVGEYVWDIKFYKEPTIQDESIINGIEVDSYYAAFKLPVCEIRPTGDKILTADNAPTSTLTPDSLNLISEALTAAAEVKAIKDEIENGAYVQKTKLSELENDIGYITNAEETDPTVPAWAKTEYKPTYTANEVGALPNTTIIPTKISDLQNDSGFVTFTDYATPSKAGVVKVSGFGLQLIENYSMLAISAAPLINIKNGTSSTEPIVTSNQHQAVFYGLAKAAGADMYNSTNGVGTYTDEAKGAIQSMIGVSSLIAPDEKNLIASKNYTTGDLITANGHLYIVTDTIEKDGSIIINGASSNVEETTIDQIFLKNTQYATSSTPGIVKVGSGLSMYNGVLSVARAGDNIIKDGSSGSSLVPVASQHLAAFYGLAKAAGDITQRTSNNTVGTYTDKAKDAILSMLGVIDLIGINENSKASQAYNIDDAFIYNGKLYKATNNIAINDNIVPDTNCVQTNLIDWIKSRN